jgi:hypothetical protein
VKRIPCRILPVLAIALAIATISGAASAQNDSPFTTNYFSNNTTEGAPAGTLRLSNDGAAVTLSFVGGFSSRTLCANIYVYAADQQLQECCSCPVTPNGLVEENIKTNLTSNTLGRVIPNEGVIQIVATVDTGVCDPTATTATTSLARGLTAWTTHIENEVGGTFPVSVTQNSPSTLSATELGNIRTDCQFATTFGSGFGICSCNGEAR